MDIVFYIIIFIVGALLGSVCAKTIQRISKGKKVLAIHSYCTNCGEKLSFFEKIPILSYILLKGKCKNCKKKINAKYIILEIITAISFLLVVRGLKISVTNISMINLISFIFVALYYSYIILVVGLDKQNKNMSASLLAYGIIISLLYIVYTCVTDKIAIYVNVIYLIIMTILLLLNIVTTKKRAKSNYIIDLLTTLLIMLIFTGEVVSILTINATLISIALYILINKIKKEKGKKKKTTFSSRVDILFIMGILNLTIFLVLINIVR